MSAWWNRTPKSQPDADARWAPTAWPGDAATVERWLRTQMLADLPDEELRVTGLDDVRTTIDLDGTDVVHLRMDASGVSLTIRPPADAAREDSSKSDAEEPAEPDIVSRTAGMLHSFRLIADPVSVQGYDIHLDAAGRSIPLDWVQYAAPAEPDRPDTAFGVHFHELDRPARPTGTFTARMRTADISRLISSLAAPLLAPTGVRLRRLDLTLTAGRRQTITLNAAAAVRWKIFGTTLRAKLVVRVSPDAVITVERVRLRSRNPIIAILLRSIRDDLRAVEGETHDLNEGLTPPGETSPRLHDLRVFVSRDTEISGRVS